MNRSGSDYTFSLDVGSNVIFIVVTAEDGTTTKDLYGDGGPGGVLGCDAERVWPSAPSRLSPGFASSTVDYTARVGNSATSVTVTPTVSEGNDGHGHGRRSDCGQQRQRLHGSQSGRGSNVITIVVAAQDGTTTQTYAVTVTRAGSSDATLSYLDHQRRRPVAHVRRRPRHLHGQGGQLGGIGDGDARGARGQRDGHGHGRRNDCASQRQLLHD